MKLYYVRNLSNEVVTLKDNYQVVLSLQPAGQADDREPVSILAMSRSDFQSYWAAGFLAVYADPAYTVAITRSSDLSEALSDGDIDERILAVGNAAYIPQLRPTWAAGTRAFDPQLGTYNLRPDNLPKWRVAKAKAAAGLGQAHVATLLDSITHGSLTATSNPKSVYSWPARMRTILQSRLGDGGTGIAVPWDSLPNTPGSPAYDTRFTFAGAITDVTYGVYSKGAKRITGTDGAANHIDFTATCDEFVVYHLTSNGGNPRVSVDGGAEGTLKPNAGSGAAVTYTHDAGYWGAGTNLGVMVTRIPVTLGAHTLRLMAPSSSGTLTVLGVEGRVAGKGVRVSNLAQSGRAMSELVSDDTTNHFYGMSITFDTFRPDLTILLCAMNDYQGHSPVATFKSRVATAIDRARATGSNAANGDVILATCPQPNYAAPIPADGVLTPALSTYYTALYELADEKDLPLIDLAWRWKDYSTSNTLGFFGDALHPNDLGSSDIAQAVSNVLLGV